MLGSLSPSWSLPLWGGQFHKQRDRGGGGMLRMGSVRARSSPEITQR